MNSQLRHTSSLRNQSSNLLKSLLFLGVACGGLLGSAEAVQADSAGVGFSAHVSPQCNFEVVGGAVSNATLDCHEVAGAAQVESVASATVSEFLTGQDADIETVKYDEMREITEYARMTVTAR